MGVAFAVGAAIVISVLFGLIAFFVGDAKAAEVQIPRAALQHRATLTREARAARAGVREDALTTPEDVLAHVGDYGQYCRKLEAGYRALTTLYNDGDSP